MKRAFLTGVSFVLGLVLSGCSAATVEKTETVSGRPPQVSSEPATTQATATPAGEAAPNGEAAHLDITDASFDREVLQSKELVLVDFWAPWCGPCRRLAPTIEELSGAYKGRLKVVKVNVDNNTRTPTTYNVRGIPNLILFKNGQVVENIVGAVPKQSLQSAIDKHL